MGNNIIMAIAMGLIYWFSRGMVGGYFALFFVGNPIFVGLISGLIYGDVLTGLIIGGGMAAVFAGIIAPGGNLPTDQGMAATTMIPIALSTGMLAEQAIAFAVPIGLLGAQLLNLRKIINIPLAHKADEYAENLDTAGIKRTAILYPFITSFFLLFIPVFVVNLFGQDVMLRVLEVTPDWIMHGLEIAGGIMPGVGFALIMNSIGKPRFIPYFLIGFILAAALGLNNLVIGVIAISIAIIIIMNRNQVTEQISKAIV